MAIQEEKHLANPDMLGTQPGRRSLLPLLSIVLLFAALLAVWHWFDHALPAPDDSSYILGGFHYADLLRHPKFWRLDWWHNMLTVNRVYPPTVMVFNGMLRLLFGYGKWVSVLSVVIFGSLLTSSVYGIGLLLSKSHRLALLAALVINLYPQTNCLSHGFALDAPLLSMVSLGLFVLLWWRQTPSWPRALICGLALGTACLTKQIAVAYLIAPGLFCLIESITKDMHNYQQYHTADQSNALETQEPKRQQPLQLLVTFLANLTSYRSVQLLSAAVLTLLVGLPWLLTNLVSLHNFAQYNESSMGRLPLWQVFSQDIVFYINSLPSIMSPLLCTVFILSLFICNRSAHKLFLPLSLSALGGIVLVSTLTWSFPSIRYDAPGLVATAVYSGCVLDKMLDLPVRKFLALLTLILGVMQFVAFNFAPYPLSTPAFIAQLSEKMGVKLVEIFGLTKRDRREMLILHSNPQPPQDWAQEWVLDTIGQIEGSKPVYLNIIPDYVQLNGNTFELLARIKGSHVLPTTSRKWTVMGDEVSFDPKVAMYYQWYLLKSGYQGNILRDDQSDKNYASLIDFVEHSGKFRLIGNHKLPDDTTIFLYRQL